MQEHEFVDEPSLTFNLMGHITDGPSMLEHWPIENLVPLKSLKATTLIFKVYLASLFLMSIYLNI